VIHGEGDVLNISSVALLSKKNIFCKLSGILRRAENAVKKMD